MKRIIAAAVFAILGLGALALELLPFANPARMALREWFGANALPATPEKIVAIQCKTIDAGIAPLDAALVLRAIERFKPAGVVFLAPIANGADAPLLLSKLHHLPMPVVFTGSGNLPVLPGVTVTSTDVTIAETNAIEPAGQLFGAAPERTNGEVFVVGAESGRAVPSTALLFLLTVSHESLLRVSGSIPGTIRAGSLVAPVNREGFSASNPIAGNLVQSIPLDDLLLRIERAERGEISPALQMLLWDRLVVVEPSNSTLATGFAALRNGLVEESTVPVSAVVAGVVLFATFPWWARRRLDRFVLALLAAFTWALLALGLYQEFRVVSPVLFVALLPVIAWLPISCRAEEPESGSISGPH